MAVEQAIAPASAIERAIAAAREALLELQQPAGHWVFELEADCTIPSEYIMMMHYLDEIDAPLEAKLAAYVREHQTAQGGWPLYDGGAFDISCSVKAYYALKLAGDDIDAPHMRRARSAILERGGAARCNVFTRITLAMFRQVPWRAAPYIPVEIVLLPRWFPFNLYKVSYWSRTVMVPLFILCGLRASARNPKAVHIRELFTVAPEHETHYFRRRGFVNRLFMLLDRLGRSIDPLVPRRLRGYALQRAQSWFCERLNGDDGLGAIFPAMVNALEALLLLGHEPTDPLCLQARGALQKLLVQREHSAYCQPCVSPVWDTALSCLALFEDGDARSVAGAERALAWLEPLQLLEERGDWVEQRPDLRGGGWAFQFHNGHYPDLDDTAAVAWAFHTRHLRGDAQPLSATIERAIDWLVGMQSRNGGFASFDADNTHYYLNEIPFADHGALLDPPTADVTARVITILGRTRRAGDREALRRAIEYLRATQEPEGGWFGRWGSNYLYGTWSALVALEAAGVEPGDPLVRRAVDWLISRQREDGGWGESNDSYADASLAGCGLDSTPYHTAWALLGLMAGRCSHADVLQRGVDFLLRTQQPGGLWTHPSFTAPGFPRVFYLKYHGYCAYFPLWALARFRRLQRDGA